MTYRNWIPATIVVTAVIAAGASCSASSNNTLAFSGGAGGVGGDTSGKGDGNANGTASGNGAGANGNASAASGLTSSSSMSGVTGSGAGGMTSATGAGGGEMIGASSVAASSSSAPPCLPKCSADLHEILDCNNNPIQTCAGTDACDPMTKTCINACTAAVNNKQSVGCEYYATDMDMFVGAERCFAAFVANTWDTPVHISVDYAGAALTVANFARLPQGQGQGLTYSAYDAVNGLPAGQMAILFLSGAKGAAPQCPTAGATTGATHQGTGVFNSFHITTDVPVVAYQINPYGGGNAAVTGASLLLPTSAWDVNYVAVNAFSWDSSITTDGMPSLNIVAAEDATTVKFTPIAALQGAGGIPSGAAGATAQFMLNKGQHAQISQEAELTGSVVETDKPVGLMAGQRCLTMPLGTLYCDHGEQMIPPVQALGHEYVGVMYRPRGGEPAIWRIVGAVPGTVLTYSNAVGGPPTTGLGQTAQFTTATPFVVSSQDAMHPFMLFAYMSGSQWTQLSPAANGSGDADVVISVPPDQYLSNYVFFADPTYPETNLVIVRKMVNGAFADVTLDCAGVLTGWTAVGTDYQWTRADLDKAFANVGNCATGRHTITSTQPFGLWVWGWGTEATGTQNVSYGYPGGMNVQPINDVVVHM